MLTADRSDARQARVTHAIGSLERAGDLPSSVNLPALEASLDILAQKEAPSELRLDAARFAQLALGDVGPLEKRPPVFGGA